MMRNDSKLQLLSVLLTFSIMFSCTLSTLLDFLLMQPPDYSVRVYENNAAIRIFETFLITAGLILSFVLLTTNAVIQKIVKEGRARIKRL